MCPDGDEQWHIAITAEMVKKLRDQTGAGMMECKNALTEANGNFEEANTILRKRGLASAAKKAGRATSEGLIGTTSSADRHDRHSRRGELRVRLRRAHPDDFQQLVADVITEIEKAGDAGDEAWLKDPQGPVVEARRRRSIAKLGENMAVPRFVRYAGQGLRRPVHPPRRQDRRAWSNSPASRRRSPGATNSRRSSRKSRCRSRPRARRYVSRDVGAGRRARKGKGHLPRADGELGQAGERDRQDRRGQARKLLQRRSCCRTSRRSATRR